MTPTGVALEFDACRQRLEQAVAEACRGRDEWAGSVAAGVNAALRFAAADPAAALVLTERATARWKEREPEFVGMVDGFAALLSRGAPPPNPRLPGPQVVVTTIARQVNLRIEAGRAEEMIEAAPDLVFLALMPFVGFAGARRWSQLSATV